MFTDNEIAFIRSQRLARLGTVSADGQPDVAAVGFEFDGQLFYIGGHNLPASRKFKNIERSGPKIALLFDDLPTVEPWSPRGLRIYGAAAVVTRAGYAGAGMYIAITPRVSWSWNIEGPAFVKGQFQTHKTTHAPAPGR